MRVNEIERFQSEEDPAGISALVRRVADGVQTYLAEVPDPYAETADQLAVSMNLSLALVVLRELPGVRDRIQDALEKFEHARIHRQALEPVEDLEELRALSAALGRSTA